MNIKSLILIRSTLSAFALILGVTHATAQTVKVDPAQEQVAEISSNSNAAAASVPVFSDYRGVRIGMKADEVRATLDRIKKSDAQDYFAYSEKESAQIYYDNNNNVMAISVDYLGGNSNAPSPENVLGVALPAKPDGSMYQLIRYPEAGYWISYNRTAGEQPIVTITMQKL